MSDYLTNLAITLTTAEPAVRPRLVGRFESVRPARFPNLAPDGVEAAPAELEMDEQTGIAQPGDTPPPAPPPAQPPGRSATVAAVNEPRVDVQRPRRPAQPSRTSTLEAAPALTQLPTLTTPPPATDRRNPTEATPQQPRRPAPAERIGVPVPAETFENTARAAQSPGQPAAKTPVIPKIQPTPRPAGRAATMTRPAATQPPRLAQSAPPVPPRPPLVTTPTVRSVPNSPGAGSVEPREPVAQFASARRVTLTPAHEEPLLAQPTNRRPIVSLPATPSVVETARSWAGGPDGTSSAQTIRVTIGRVEVRAAAPSAPPPPAAPRKPVVSLAEYLAQRNGDRQ